jgi:hypothetical protein
MRHTCIGPHPEVHFQVLLLWKNAPPEDLFASLLLVPSLTFFPITPHFIDNLDKPVYFPFKIVIFCFGTQ